MFFDFPTFLYLLAVFALIVWLYDAWKHQTARDDENKKAREKIAAKEQARGKPLTDKEKDSYLSHEPVLVEYSKAFFPIIVLVLLLRSFLAEPFKIPSDSMVPTLLDGDFILVSKYAYGIRLPVINAHVAGNGKPLRGDVAVFRFPFEPTTNFIKRVIGLPGDTIEYNGKKITVTTADGQKINIQYERLPSYQDLGAGLEYSRTGHGHFRETLGKVGHNIVVRLDHINSFQCLDDKRRFVVPANHYFVMGDNRDYSNDSRSWCAVPEENLVGRAFAVWFNWDSRLKSVRFDRMFRGIK
jgi:signal peptidase I